MPVNLGPAFLLLSAAILASLSALLWMMGCRWFKKNIHETTADNHDVASENNSDTALSMRELSQGTRNDFAHSRALQQRILVNLRAVEHNLAELRQFLLARRINAEITYREMCKREIRTAKLKQAKNKSH
ncbi:kita-kyushu lung cancer antigen 1 homolog [Notamacropus eugenii]|uniref:kita-kyushu lung cancer antigen 1 homolog n=1 Tax=Notamacropus eugenii TaxID=9315 RepID=UPI003B67C36D